MERKLQLDIIVKPKTDNMIIYRYKVKKYSNKISMDKCHIQKILDQRNLVQNVYGLFLIILLIQIFF